MLSLILKALGLMVIKSKTEGLNGFFSYQAGINGNHAKTNLINYTKSRGQIQNNHTNTMLEFCTATHLMKKYTDTWPQSYMFVYDWRSIIQLQSTHILQSLYRLNAYSQAYKPMKFPSLPLSIENPTCYQRNWSK